MPATVIVKPVAGPNTYLNSIAEVPGGTDKFVAITDGSDSTYDEMNNVTSTLSDWDVSAIPAGVPILYVQVKCRYGGSTGSNQGRIDFIVQDSVSFQYLTNTVDDGYFSTPHDMYGPQIAHDYPGNPWTAASIQARFRVLFNALPNFGGELTFLRELVVLVAYKSAPVTSAVTATANLYPTIGWTFADDPGVTQQRFRVKVFTAAVVGGGGFDPETSPFVVDSGEANSAGTSWLSTTPIFTAGTYYAYVKTSDSVPGGAANWSAWADASFVLAPYLSPPPVILTATPDDASASVALTVRAFSNMLPWGDSACENSPPGLTVVNASVSRATFALYTPPGQAQLGRTYDIVVAGDGDVTIEYPAVPCAPGQHITGVVVNEITSGRSNPARFCSLYWFDSSNSPIGSPSVGSTFTASGYVEGYVDAVAPTGTAAARLMFSIPSALFDEEYVIGAASIFPGTHAEYVAKGGWARGGDVQSPIGLVLERSIDGGITWVRAPRLFRSPQAGFYTVAPGVFGATPVTFAGNEPAPGAYPVMSVDQHATIIDYEVPRGVPVSYRLAVTSLDPAGVPLQSLWSTVAAISVPVAVDGTRFKAVHQPALNRRLYTKRPGIQASNREPQVSDDVLGSQDVAVLFDTLKGDLLTYTIRALSQADHDAYRALQAAQDTVLIQDFLGRQWYTHLGPALTVVPLEADGFGNAAYDMAHTAQQIAAP